MPSHAPFGRAVSAMVTPMNADGSLDLDGATRVATFLADHGHDGIVVSGTTGESPTTTDAEKVALLEAVVAAVGDGVRITAGVGTNDTAHSVECAKAAQAAGAHALLAVTPYYNKPPQDGIRAHFEAIADATDLPVLLYDIPGRSVVPLTEETIRALAAHPRIQGMKDAKADYWQAGKLIADTDLTWLSGDDAANLLHFANGAHGFVGVTSQVAPERYAEMLDAVDAGDFGAAREIHRRLVPLVEAIMNVTQGAIAAKAGLVERGVLSSAAVRLPLVEASSDLKAQIKHALDLVVPV
jgi:4-hydroxy-tetrahydrodipicolinate synthase